MGNLNINKTTTDTQDNVKYSHNRRTIDYRGITILIIGTFAILTVIWLVILGAAAINCALDDKYTCPEVTYVFWGYVILLAIALGIGLFGLLSATFNIEFLQWRGVITDRRSIRAKSDAIISVALQSAKSEATAGMDNYSPSSNTTTTSASVDQPTEEGAPTLPPAFVLGDITGDE